MGQARRHRDWLAWSLDPKTKIMHNGNSLVFRDQDFSTDLAQAIGWTGPVMCDNDANCFLRSEMIFSSALSKTGEEEEEVNIAHQRWDHLGTGVGWCFYNNGHYLTGRTGSAVELGHTELWSHGLPCYCGQLGCVEQYLSGPALEAAYGRRMYQQIKARPTCQEIFDLASSGEPLALAEVKKFKSDLTKFCAQIVQTFDPDRIILGGGVSQQAYLYEGLRQSVADQTFSKTAPPIHPQTLNMASGALGAAGLLLEKELPIGL